MKTRIDSKQKQLLNIIYKNIQKTQGLSKSTFASTTFTFNKYINFSADISLPFTACFFECK